MNRVYIVSPLRGDIRGNIEKAKRYCRETAKRGALPLAAHVYFTQFLNDDIPTEREAGLRMGLELLKLCDEVHVYGDTISEGMAAEIEAAKRLGLPIQYFNH
jgi:dienelactone hydrolase